MSLILKSKTNSLTSLTSSDVLKWFKLMKNITKDIKKEINKEINIKEYENNFKEINILNSIIRTINNNNNNNNNNNQNNNNKRKLKPEEWGYIDEDTTPTYQNNNNNNSNNNSNKKKYNHLIISNYIENQFQEVYYKTEEVNYRFLELSSSLDNQNDYNNNNNNNHNNDITENNLDIPLVKHELLCRKLNREWWSSHSNLLETKKETIQYPPADEQDYENCLVNFTFFLHNQCLLSRRRSLDLARYFIQMGYYNEIILKQMIETNSLDWFFEFLSDESPNSTNQNIISEINLIWNNLQNSSDNINQNNNQYEQINQRFSVKIENDDNINYINNNKYDDDWDDKIIKINERKDITSTTQELLESIQHQLIYIQQNIQQLDTQSSTTLLNLSIPNNTQTISESYPTSNELNLTSYEQIFQQLLQVNMQNQSLVQKIPETSTNSINSQVISNIVSQTMLLLDSKLSPMISDMSALRNQSNNIGLQLNQIQLGITKHDNMLTSLLTEEFRVPKFPLLLPHENSFLSSSYANKYRLFFICPITLKRAESGRDKKGYEITVTKDWLIKYAPAIKIGLHVANFAVLASSIFCPPMQTVSGVISSSIDIVTKIIDTCITKETQIIDKILSQTKSLGDIYHQFQTNKQFLDISNLGFREMYHCLHSLELSESNNVIPGTWMPKYTGLVLTHSNDGTSEWVDESVVDEYKQKGKSLLFQTSTDQIPPPPPPPPPPRSPRITHTSTNNDNNTGIDCTTPSNTPTININNNNSNDNNNNLQSENIQKYNDEINSSPDQILSTDVIQYEIIPLDNQQEKVPSSCCIIT